MLRRSLAVVWGLLTICGLAALPGGNALAATGCSLDNPEEDLRRLFPTMTDFTVAVTSFAVQAPERHPELSRLLGDAIDPVYEAPEVPYNLYTVIANGTVLGHVFGTNQRGTYSSIQVIAVTGPGFDLTQIYLQKLRSPAYKQLQDPVFLEDLATIPMVDFPKLAACYVRGECAGVSVPDPSGGEQVEDYRHLLRGLAKLHIVQRLLLAPPIPRAPRDEAARAQRVASWWDGEEPPAALLSPRFSRRESWPDETPVLLWPDASTPTIWPLPVLQRHPLVLHDAGSRQLAVTWSAPTGTAVVLVAPSGFDTSGLVPTDSTVSGVRCIAHRPTGTLYNPIDPRPLRGDGTAPTLTRLGGTFVTTWATARRLAPRAQVLAADDVHAATAAWRAASNRYPRPVQEPVIARGTDLAHPQAVGASVTVVPMAADAAIAFESTPGLTTVSRDPWTGRPWLWDPGSGQLIDGANGSSVLGGTQVLGPLPMFHVPRPVLGALGVSVTPSGL